MQRISIWCHQIYYNDKWDTDSSDSTLMLSDDLSNSSDALSQFNNLENITSALAVYDGLNPIDTRADTVNISTTIHNAWTQSLQRRIWYPELMTILNVGTNHLSGRFAGITDYAATQLLFAGCQELPFNASVFPVTAPFDYYTNLRLNNMPHATVGVIQAFDDETYLNKAEITLPIGQALAAGLNGFVLLKTDLTQTKENADSWNMAMNLLNSIGYLEENKLLNVLAVNGAQVVASSDLSLWSALRAIDSLIVVGVNTDCNGYDVSQCGSGYVPHWECKENTVKSVNITIPLDWREHNDFRVSVLEIVNGTERKPDFEYNLYQNHSFLVFDNVQLDADETTRIFLVDMS